MRREAHPTNGPDGPFAEQSSVADSRTPDEMRPVRARWSPTRSPSTRRTARQVITEDDRAPDETAHDPAISAPRDSSSPDGPDHRGEAPRWTRAGFRLAQLLVLVPVWVAAYRDGKKGWYPTLDAATTTLRARDVLEGHFPLIGMWTSVSTKVGTPTYFPGATELYLLSVPVHLFGDAWGPLIAMAAINSAWLVLAGWLLRRRLGYLGATWALVALGLLVWTMGSEALIDVAPMQMITLPFALFLIAVWSVADRDLAVIPLLVFVANFLLLNHLVLTLLVPVIGLCAPVALFIVLRAERRRAPDLWPATRRTLLVQLVIGAAITVVLWLPTLIQQFTNSPGNLTNLYNASRVDLARTVDLTHALDVVVTMLAQPPFWFRNTFNTPLTTTPLSPLQMVFGVVFIAGLGYLAVLAARRRDRLVVTALAITAVALIAATWNILNAPTDFGFRRGYFRSLWGTMMFVWMTVALAVVRALPRRTLDAVRSSRVTLACGVAATAVVALLAVPHQDPGKGTNGSGDASVALAQKLNNRGIVALRDRGQVQVAAGGDFSSYALSSSLILALDTYGVDVCVPKVMVPQFGKHRACDAGGPDLYATVSSAAFPPYPGEKIEFEATLLTKAERRARSRLAGRVADWLGSQTEIHASPRVRKTLVDAYGEDAADRYEAKKFDTKGFPLTSLMISPDFVDFVATRSYWNPDGTPNAAIDTGDLDPAVLMRWADLVQREYTGESVRVVTSRSAPGKLADLVRSDDSSSG